MDPTSQADKDFRSGINSESTGSTKNPMPANTLRDSMRNIDNHGTHTAYRALQNPSVRPVNVATSSSLSPFATPFATRYSPVSSTPRTEVEMEKARNDDLQTQIAHLTKQVSVMQATSSQEMAGLKQQVSLLRKTMEPLLSRLDVKGLELSRVVDVHGKSSEQPSRTRLVCISSIHFGLLFASWFHFRFLDFEAFLTLTPLVSSIFNCGQTLTELT